MSDTAEFAATALRASTVRELLRADRSLTHRIHVGEGRGSRRRPMTEAEVADLRAQRDLIEAELLRRCGEA